MKDTTQFVIWLDGFISACGDSLNEEQTSKIKEKLNKIFVHEAGNDTTDENLHFGKFTSEIPPSYDARTLMVKLDIVVKTIIEWD
jgi:hypothetical protein